MNYFLLAVVLFFTEVAIALFVRDTIIRPYGGDLLVVIFLYCLLKSFFRIPVKNAIFGVLLFCFFIEALQYFQFIRLLDLQDDPVASAVLGSHFEWLDILLYLLGGLSIFIAEAIFRRKRATSA